MRCVIFMKRDCPGTTLVSFEDFITLGIYFI